MNIEQMFKTKYDLSQPLLPSSLIPFWRSGVSSSLSLSRPLWREELHEIGPIFNTMAKAWDEMASHYNDEQIVFLLEFLKRSNVMSRREIVRLREAPAGEEGIFSAPLGDLESGRLVVSSGISRLTLRADDVMAALYQARFEGPVPDVKAKDGAVTIRDVCGFWTGSSAWQRSRSASPSPGG